mmetsp:Transcript_122216/g.342098  ORF Transcript_122216/g.342098 Transcript_122216/m.342098 type:complete len:162 (+) Transcript_122216:89-574(+)
MWQCCSCEERTHEEVAALVRMEPSDARVAKEPETDTPKEVTMGEATSEAGPVKTELSISAVDSEWSPGIKVKRSLRAEFDVVLEKSSPDVKLGLDTMARTAPSPALRIRRVKPGMVEEWNNANPEKALRVGDLITSVNGTADDLYGEIARSTRLALRVQRR